MLHAIFLQLLSSAIWDKQPNVPEIKNLSEEQWNRLLTFTDKQSCRGLIADAIERLPEKQQPPKPIRFSFLLGREQIEHSNQLLEQVFVKLVHCYNELGIDFILLKGLSNNPWYPHPEHRTPGDIDVFIYPVKSYDKANNWVREQGFEQEKASSQHQGYTLDGIHIENHWRMTTFESERYNLRWKQEVNKLLDNKSFDTIEVSEASAQILPPTFNAFYLFVHIFRHFIHIGIGIRQVCDWILFLDKNQERIDYQELRRLLNAFDLTDAVGYFGLACVRHLQANPNIFGVDVSLYDTQLSDSIMEDILAGGNFGYHKTDLSMKLTWKGRFNRFVYSIKRARQFSRIAPNHTQQVPIHKLKNRLLLMARDLFGVDLFHNQKQNR